MLITEESDKLVGNVVKQEITYYKEPQAGYVGWFVTKKGTYFIDEDGLVRNVYGVGLKTDLVVEDCNI